MEARDFKKFQKSLKNVKNLKMPKIVPKSNQTYFEHVLGQVFRKVLPSFPLKVESSNIFNKIKKFRKKPKIFKIPKTPKIVPKSIQTCFEHVLGQIVWKIFAQFSMECFFENFQKIKKISKFQILFHGGSRLLNLEKNRKKLDIPNLP